ncbi:DegT/DnrJ/EryC1/StrS family aminotransferase [Anaerocolumna chitinilytica]|uniref:DegT/DnrJ/EryC1/StrS family aminotransferase n=1 Tax=Anaerocolumna chitinilytica TaxID=1727145 RepID=A0A7M3SA76_9FIRM|nr:DegT/DnrJ/EryC1/StrS family aminotransferase [Anaerocolumna chitinilytica]BCK01494.1 hypothetical protein bsdcttw_45340 [Anaerocolumna chitinilytica]
MDKNEVLAFYGGNKSREQRIVPRTVANEKTKTKIIDMLNAGQYSDWYGGKATHEFEEKFAEWNNVKHAIAVNSGTAALHTAVIAAGIGPGDEVILPTTSFVTAASAILLQNAIPVVCDIEKNSLNIDINDLKKRIGPRTKAIIAVHLYGYPTDMEAICQVAKDHNLVVIEDCGQAHGAMLNGNKVGTFGSVACFSFAAPRKILTVGEGGMVITNDDVIADICRQVVNKGKENGWSTHKRMGFGYMMSEFESTLGIQGIEDIENEIMRRRNVAHVYEEVLSDCGIDVGIVPDNIRHIYFRKALKLPYELTAYRDWFIYAVEAENISIKPPHDLLHQIEWLKNKNAYNNEICPYKCSMRQELFTEWPDSLPVADVEIPRTVDLETGPSMTVDDAYVSAKGILKVYKYLEKNNQKIEPLIFK